MHLLAWLATALDTLPMLGRVMLLGSLLALAFIGFSRLLPQARGTNLRILFHKGAFTCLMVVPVLVYAMDVQVPVRVDELVRWQTPWPAYAAYGLAAAWLVGACLGWHRLWQAYRRTYLQTDQTQQASPSLKQAQSRLGHWQQRLNLGHQVNLVFQGGTLVWHRSGYRHATIVLPSAALNWPVGLLDVMLLSQLAQIQQRTWRWLLFGRVVQALYWPFPGLRTLVTHLAADSTVPALQLARSAYRDPEGWRRDVRKLMARAESLEPIAMSDDGQFVRVPNDPSMWELASPAADLELDAEALPFEEQSFEEQWAVTKRRREAKVRDPYEQAYWLIASACVLAGVATTLTLSQRAPEFEPAFLEVKWQDQMLRSPLDGGPKTTSISVKQALRSAQAPDDQPSTKETSESEAQAP